MPKKTDIERGVGALPDDAPPGAQPVKERKTRTLCVAVPGEQAEQVRLLAGKTGITQQDLLRAVEKSPEVAAAITATLKRQWNLWKEKQDRDDIFGTAPAEPKPRPIVEEPHG